jgi:RNA polymerase subunit RPABC4/transcription elongation factor Spt4
MEIKVCQYCGAELEPEDKVCPCCGTFYVCS